MFLIKISKSEIENQNAKQISKKFNTEHHDLVVDKFDVNNFLEYFRKIW